MILLITANCCWSCGADDKKSVAATPPSSLIADTVVTVPQDTIEFHKEEITPPPYFGIKKVGYILSFRKPNSIPAIRFKQCNAMIFASAKVTYKGLSIPHSQNLEEFSKKASAADCKMLLGISGTNKLFAYVTATAGRRNKLVKEIMDAVAKYRLQGVDIDWEFPSVLNKTNLPFTAFLKELSDSCHKDGKYYLSCAIAPGVSGGRRSSAINSELLTGDWVDWFNIMVYDNFSTTTPYLHHSDINMAITSFTYWRRVRKMKKEKCVMGLPLYGRPSGIEQRGRVKTYAAILQHGGSPYKDSATIKIDTARSKDSLTHYTIYYDGIRTIQKKARGAVQYGDGIMFWETGQDANSKFSLISAAIRSADAVAKARKEKSNIKTNN